MKTNTYYFIGIGGIGMSSIARFLLQQGNRVGGYDRTPSTLTQALQQQGAT
ncbi:MAG: Mur ligase domain-containing protein, partial [Flavobacteriaceae bacterium]